MKVKRIFSLLLTLAMLCGVLSVGATVASAEEEKEWVTMYDWESDDQFNNISYETLSEWPMYVYVSSNPFSEITGSTRGVDFRGNGGNYDEATQSVQKWFSIPVTEQIQNASNIRMPLSISYNSAGKGFIGVKINGTIYWDQYRDHSYSWYSFVGRTLYTNWEWPVESWGKPDWYMNGKGESITITSENIKDVTEICLSAYAYDYQPCYIDDIQVEVPVTSEPSPKATFDNGVADVEAVNGVVTLPDATVEGKQLFGWQDAEGNVYKVGAEVEIAEDTAFTAVAAAIELQTGAGIRWAELETERGIRFETTVSKDALDALGSSNFELGALILPYENYNADITVETASSYGALNVVDPKVYGTVEDNYRYYTGVVDFEKYFAASGAALADLKLTAVSYVKVTYSDGEVAYFYDMPDATNNVRTVAEVARAALADTEFGYTAAQVDILHLYTQYSEEDTIPEYRKDEMDKIQ